MSRTSFVSTPKSHSKQPSRQVGKPRDPGPCPGNEILSSIYAADGTQRPKNNLEGAQVEGQQVDGREPSARGPAESHTNGENGQEANLHEAGDRSLEDSKT